MKRKRPLNLAPIRRYRSPNIPMAAIRRFARQVAEQFHPEKIILFGSYAYGQPNADSDVDILVVMPARDEHSLTVKILLAVDAPFPMDLVVRTPKRLESRLAEGDSFLREIVTRGKILHEETHPRVGPQGRRRLCRRPSARGKKRAPA